MSTLMTRRNPEPWTSLTPIRALRHDIDWLFNRFAPDWDGPSAMMEFNPPCDLSETADAFQICMDAPGLKPDDFEIEVIGDSVRITGSRHEEKEENGKTFHRIERRSGQFCECVSLPGNVKEREVEAEYQDGILRITLPKAEASKSHTVKVKSKPK